MNHIRSIPRVEKDKQRDFNKLARRFRKSTDPKKTKRLGEQLGQMIFGR